MNILYWEVPVISEWLYHAVSVKMTWIHMTEGRGELTPIGTPVCYFINIIYIIKSEYNVRCIISIYHEINVNMLLYISRRFIIAQSEHSSMLTAFYNVHTRHSQIVFPQTCINQSCTGRRTPVLCVSAITSTSCSIMDSLSDMQYRCTGLYNRPWRGYKSSMSRAIGRLRELALTKARIKYCMRIGIFVLLLFILIIILMII